MKTKMVVATVKYTVDLMVPVDEKGDADPTLMIQSLESYGARNVDVTLAKYTGAGDHEFVSSANPAIQVQRCIKCLCRQDGPKAHDSCPGLIDD